MRATLSSAAIVSAVATFLTQAAPPPQQQIPTAAQQASSAPDTIKTHTRLVTVDVVVTDSHGKSVRGLTQDDFQLSEEHAGPQKILKFRFVDASANLPAGNPRPASSHVYSNQTFDKLTVPPSVLLLDALNTEIQNQAQARQHMLVLLKTLPATTPVAVLVLGHTLHVVQDFTTDPALLRAAVDRTLRSPDIEQDPQDDPDSPSNLALDQNGDQETAEIQGLEQFEKLEYEGQMAIRVDETTDAMVGIAKYLGGYPGRKNLLWFSSAFPNWIEPTSDFGTDSFAGSASYADKIRTAYESLADAQIAVYPVDARGLETSQVYSSARNTRIRPNNPGSFGGQISRENAARYNSQATMEQIAEGTGGKTCVNTNDLSGCVANALNDSSAYYELAYNPENIRWDGLFHKITVKSNQHGIKLRYRTGYIATDPATISKGQTPEKLLQETCKAPLPSTSIPLSAVAIEPSQQVPEKDAAQVRYMVTVSPAALSLSASGTSHELHLQMAVCEYNPREQSFAFYPRDISQSLSDAKYQDLQADGLRNIFDYGPKPESKRLRLAVLDVPSGSTGSVDVPAHPHEFASMPASFTSNPPASAPANAANGVSTARQVVTSLSFKSSSGKASKLDWKTDKLLYEGDLDIGLGATAFFQRTVGSSFHCQGGSLLPNDAGSTAVPSLIFLFQSLAGPAVQVDMTGSETKYSGRLPIDATAKPFFDQVWKLCHCQQP